jgi:5-methylcytosine-specific restriction endonuclease McrA
MFFDHLHDAITSAKKANVELAPDLLHAADALHALAAYAELKKLASYGEAALAQRVDDAEKLARVSGTSVAKAKQTVETGKALRDSDVVRDALAGGSISFDQASEIMKAEKAAPGAAEELLSVASRESFHVLRERSRRVVLEAGQHRDLGQRQREARSVRHFIDDLGMCNINLKLPPHLGSAIVNRAEAEAKRLHRGARRETRTEPYERHLADAFAKMMAGSDVKGHSKRPELVVLVSYEVAKRGWSDVRPGEVCKIPGIGPVPPEVAREIAADAFLTGLFFDGQDLRNIKSWTRNWPVEVRRALNLGEPPEFDGLKCVDCGNRFHVEDDHLAPYLGGQNPSALWNHGHRCWSCHVKKTDADRRAGKLKREPHPAPGGSPSSKKAKRRQQHRPYADTRLKSGASEADP